MSDHPATFVCADCGGTFPWHDEDKALEELRRKLPGVPLSQCVIVCDDCYLDRRSDAPLAGGLKCAGCSKPIQPQSPEEAAAGSLGTRLLCDDCSARFAPFSTSVARLQYGQRLRDAYVAEMIVDGFDQNWAKATADSVLARLTRALPRAGLSLVDATIEGRTVQS